VLEKPDCLRLDKLVDHVTEHSSNSVEPLICMANVCQTGFIQQNLLDNENGDSFRQLGASFHNAKTERNDLCRKKEVDDGVIVVLLGNGTHSKRGATSWRELQHLDESTDDSKRSESQIFKRSSLRCRIEERVEE
jgi:hypothetical protein